MLKPDISNLDDIILFVNDFYNKVKEDPLIGPVFNDVIDEWSHHLERMYKFWNAALLGVPGFTGNPFAKHAPLPINVIHFEKWLLLFKETIDLNFEGDMANEAKYRAELMAAMFLKRLGNMKGGSDKVLL
ncbi:group III truncated hemoglobin [Pedobacter sp. P351]|uniref:group III truncated hemoglobin n=1 Tax=Pedobacter superstes TaxID=3133441 RepID=UPI0030981FD5